MDKIKLEELRNKIVEGLKLSAQRLIETKAKNNGLLAISRNGKVLVVKASELLNK